MGLGSPLVSLRFSLVIVYTPEQQTKIVRSIRRDIDQGKIRQQTLFSFFYLAKRRENVKTKESYRISKVSILLEIREVGLVFHVGGMEKNIFSDNDYIKASAVRNDVKAISYSLAPSCHCHHRDRREDPLIKMALSFLYFFLDWKGNQLTRETFQMCQLESTRKVNPSILTLLGFRDRKRQSIYRSNVGCVESRNKCCDSVCVNLF